MKQSLVDAMNEARELSIKHIDETYYVMDKKRNKAKCHSKTFLDMPYFSYRLISDGYYPYCKFVNGVESRV